MFQRSILTTEFPLVRTKKYEMARNCEKHNVGLNRVFLEQQWNREKELKRPPLHTLNTAADVRKWIPSIKKDIEYFLRQLSGARGHDYQRSKYEEFENCVKELEKEYKQFVKKVFELDPNQPGIPWQPKGYISKRKLKETSPADNEKTKGEPMEPQCSSQSSISPKKRRIVLNVLKKYKQGEG